MELQPLEELCLLLERCGHAEVARDLAEAALRGSTASEILGEIGLAMKRYRDVRARLADEDRALWDLLAAYVRQAWPRLI